MATACRTDVVLDGLDRHLAIGDRVLWVRSKIFFYFATVVAVAPKTAFATPSAVDSVRLEYRHVDGLGVAVQRVSPWAPARHVVLLPLCDN